MAYIRPLKNGKFRADVRMKGITRNKTFSSKKLAKLWASKVEGYIKKIHESETDFQKWTWGCWMQRI